MKYSPLLQRAIDVAIETHMGQVRKGKQVPYVTHVLSVGLILARVTDDEEIIAAGILHDTVEDSEGPNQVTVEDLEIDFGKRVAAMVNDVTEPSFAQGYGRARQNKKATWLQRKMAALNHIKDMQHDSKLVKSADVLHNLTELVQDLEKDGDKVWERFNASKADTIKRYNALIPELKRTWSENPLIEDLEAAHKDLMEVVDETE